MFMKRFYKTPKDWKKETDAKGNCTNPPPLDYVGLIHTGITADQNFSTRMVMGGLSEGWLDITDTEIKLMFEPETLIYTIKRKPGRYCLHCGEKLADDATGALARIHVAQKHAGKESPDKRNAGGYEMINHYECVLDAKQHEKYRVKDVTKPPRTAHRRAAG